MHVITPVGVCGPYKVFGAGLVSKLLLAWMVHLDLLMDLKDFDAESGPWISDIGEEVKAFEAGAPW